MRVGLYYYETSYILINVCNYPISVITCLREYTELAEKETTYAEASVEEKLMR